MARKIILETVYTFTPASRTVVIPKYIPRERLVLITNVTTNQVIYNFSDPSLRATSYTATITSTMTESTTIVLNYNTTLMSASDKLQITIDDFVEKFEPAETQLDPNNKLRVTEPQALIDTDFEYGTQITKWENLSTVNQRPSFYVVPSNVVPNVTGMAMSAGSRTVTVTTSAPHGLVVGQPIQVLDSFLMIANGNYIVDSVPSTTTFTYQSASQNPTAITALLDTNKTTITVGTLYTGSAIGAAPTMSYNATTGAVTVTTTVPHGLALGNEIFVTGVTMSGGSNPPNGSFYVATVTSPTSFIYYYLGATMSGTITATSAAIYVRPQGTIVHRPLDGGVLFTNGAGSNNQMTSRQTRRYFRYQSGKGIQASSGTVLKPSFQVDTLTSSGTTVTVQTKERHGIQPGATIVVSGATETAYNGTFTVTSILSVTRFQYTAGSVPSASPASGSYTVAINTWYGSTNRLGIFDQQNGMFWEFDGQTLSAVRRSSTYQVSGRVTVTANSATVSQTDVTYATSFTKQLTPGDFIVIRGQSYRVTDIASDTSLTINPPYRGSTASFVQVSKTVDTKVANSAFNIDRLDGTGPSGYNIDLTKMQMFYIDYTWYGAGFIRFGVRGPQGNVIYAHKVPNNNVNAEAYMRSGNLPARYESATMAVTTTTTATINPADATLNVANQSAFPTAGTLCIRNGSTYEYVNYTGKTSTTQFTGVTRAQAGTAAQTYTIAAGANSGTVTANTGIQIGQRVVSDAFPEDTYVSVISGTTITVSQAATTANPSVIFSPMAGAAQTFTYSATAPTVVELAFPQFGSTINHWGTSVIMDGKFDDDKSLIFTYGQTAFTNIPAATTTSATTASGSAGAYTFSVSSASGILPGMTAIAVGIPTGALVTNVNGLNITINQPISTALSSTSITFNGGNSKALMSIRIAPSVDNGVTGAFGARELLNRVQLQLNALGISTKTTGASMLVRAYLNAAPNGTTAWTNAVGNQIGAVNSSLGQIADYAAGSTVVFGGEITAGFFVTGTDRLDLHDVRDLGNSVLGGGGATSNTQIYPDGPDVLTIVVTNLGSTAVDVLGRLSWTEAQA